jgi:hypothetical protein
VFAEKAVVLNKLLLLGQYLSAEFFLNSFQNVTSANSKALLYITKSVIK